MSFRVSKKTIGELISDDNLFVLPAYQRPFSWTSEEAIRLLDDISIAFAEQDNEEFFIGTCVCVEQELLAGQSQPEMPKLSYENHSMFDVLGIIDGQQRLATLTMLLAVLRDLSDIEKDRRFIRDMLELPGGVHSYRLILFTNDAEIFEQYVQPDGSTKEQCDNPDLRASQERILEIRDIFKKRLSKMAPEHRSGLIKFIARNVFLIHVTTDDLDEGYKIFLGINETGRKLGIADIGRAVFLGSVPSDVREETTRIWRRNEDMLGAEFDAIFGYVQRIHGRRNPKVIAENIVISKHAGGSAPYINNIINPLADAMIYIKHPYERDIPKDHDIHRYLIMLRWITNTDWMPPALQFISTHKNQTDEISAFLRELHRLVFGLTILGRGKSKRITRHNSLIRDIRDNQHWDKSVSRLFLTPDEQAKILYQLTFNLYKSSSQSAKLILLYLNDLFAGGDLGHHPGEISVEHVCPDHPSQKSEWRIIFSVANERDACRSSLGNLVPLPLEMNLKIKNKDFDDKLDIIFQEDDVTGVRKPTEFAMTNRLLGLAKWDYAKVMENETLYLDMLKKALRLDGPCGMELRAPKKSVKKIAE